MEAKPESRFEVKAVWTAAVSWVFLFEIAAAGFAGEPAEKSAAKRASPAGSDTIATKKGDLEISPIEHATLVLRWSGKTIYVDPVGPAERFRSFPRADLILVTHEHGDHLSAKTIAAVSGEKTKIVLPKAARDALLKENPGLAGAAPKAIEVGGKTEFEGIAIEAIAAYNLTSDRLKYHAKGRGVGYVLDFAGTRVYISGDTEDVPEMRSLRDIDVAFVCMNLPYTMTPEQAASAILEFQPKIVYPYHSRGQDAEKLKALVESKSKKIEVRIRDWYPRPAK